MNMTPERDKRETEAIHWFAEFEKRDEWSVAKCEEWDRWIAAAENRIQYEEIGQLDKLLREQVPRPPLPSAVELKGDSISDRLAGIDS